MPRWEKSIGTLCRAEAFRGRYGKYTGVSSSAAAGAPFFFTPSTRRENEGSVSFSFWSSTAARTIWPAKMCSGRFRRMSTPISVREERMPDMRMLAIRQARTRKRRLLPVLMAARATSTIIHAVADPAKRRAFGQHGNQRDGHPSGHHERGDRGNAGQKQVAKLRGSAGVESENQRNAEGRHGKKEGADRGAIRFGDEAGESSGKRRHVGDVKTRRPAIGKRKP